MRKSFRWFVVSVAAAGLALAGLPASATHNADVHSANLTLLANSAKTGATIVNSDIAFWGNRAYSGYLGASGSAGGFRILNIANPAAPTVVVDFPCAGSQNDISVWNNDTDAAADLLFLSVDTPMSNTTCTATQTRNTAGNFLADPAEWEGVRIFDINLETTPVLLANVPTDCGSHTHTLLPGKGANANKLYIYVSSYPSSRSAVTTNLGGTFSAATGLRDNGTECVEPEPGITGKIHNKVSIITVDLAAPAAADDPTGVAPNLSYAAVTEFTLDGGTRWSHRVGPTQGAAPVAQRAFDFTACHDISVFWEIDLAGGACWEEGQLWDVSNPTAPQILRRFRNNDVSDLFHSATFSWDGQIVAWEDEAGGGVDDRCRSVEDKQGRMYFYTVSGKFLSDFKIPRVQPEDEVCTAHNYNFVPQTNGRHILVSAWYEGGTSVIDLTQPTNPKEIGFYVAKTPPADTEVWSSYWYNGNIYANDERRGTDVFAFNDSRVDAAITLPFLNAQTQMNLIPQVAPKCRGQAATILGSSGADTLIGTPGPDVIVGLGGADTISGLGGGDRICGGAGKDKVNGGAGPDRLSGNTGADRLSGGPGADRLNGGPGRDRCNGGPGVDAVTRCEVIIG